MDLHAPRIGSLHLAAVEDGTGDERTVLADGDGVVATVRPSLNPRPSNRIAFDVVDLDGMVVAHGGRHPDTVRKLQLRTVEGAPLLDLHPGWLRTSRLALRLPDGTALGVKATRRYRRFTVRDRDGREVAAFGEMARSWFDERCPCQVTLRAPVFTTVQAIGLAVFLQARARAMRSSSG